MLSGWAERIGVTFLGLVFPLPAASFINGVKFATNFSI